MAVAVKRARRSNQANILCPGENNLGKYDQPLAAIQDQQVQSQHTQNDNDGESNNTETAVVQQGVHSSLTANENVDDNHSEQKALAAQE